MNGRAKKNTSKASAKTPAKNVKPGVVEFSRDEIRILAKIDVGFGNELLIRGEGGGLSWDSGQAMTCVESDQWSFTLKSETPIMFKLMLNDLAWCAGDDFVVQPGETVTVVPIF